MHYLMLAVTLARMDGPVKLAATAPIAVVTFRTPAQVADRSIRLGDVAPVQVLIDGKQEASLSVSVRLVHRAATLVAARDIPAGSTISEADVKIEERPVLPGPVNLSNPEAVIGQQALLPIKAGSVFS